VNLDLNGSPLGLIQAGIPLEMTLPGNQSVSLRLRNPQLSVDVTRKVFIRRDAKTRVSYGITTKMTSYDPAADKRIARAESSLH
jgi:hypothetical protein